MEKLNKNIETDVCIIGGGLAALVTALKLSEAGFKVCILEADRVGNGNTEKSSAIVTVAHDLIYYRLIKKHGLEVAKKYLEIQEDALQEIKNLGAEESDFIFEGSKRKLRKEKAAYGKLGHKDFPILKNQAILNPKEFVRLLVSKLKNVEIFENTKVSEKPDGNRLKVGEHTVTANFFVVATHFPYFVFPGLYFVKMYQHRSYNIIFRGKINHCCEGKKFEIRPFGEDAVMVCGGHVRTGKSKNQYKKVLKFARRRGLTEEVSRYAAQDCMTPDLLPYAGKVYDNVYVITGFNKWGFTNSFACANIVTDLIKGKNSGNIFCPSRPLSIKILANFGNAVVNLLKIGGPRCTHMGCKLKWNKHEKSWDCPCHGSRFNKDGKILDGPATKCLKKISD